jgi:hypothetical protein
MLTINEHMLTINEHMLTINDYETWRMSREQWNAMIDFRCACTRDPSLEASWPQEMARIKAEVGGEKVWSVLVPKKLS